MKTSLSLWLLIILIFARCGWAQEAPPDFRPLVRAALSRGEKRIVIAPGVYRLAPEAGQGIVWTLRGVQDTEIVAEGVTLICTKLTRALMLDRCRNLTLRGLTVDYDPLPFTQGEVVAVADDKSWIDVKLHEGYPRRALARIDIVDAQTRFRKKGMPFLWGTKAALSAPDTVRVSLKGIGNAAAVGDLASLSGGAEPGGVVHGVTIENCEAVTLRAVTLCTAPGMGILESDGEGRAQYLGCKIVPGPPPPGAAQARLLTTTWDAMQSKCIRVGPRVENCTIEDAGGDSWSVQSSDFLVVKRDGAQVVLASRDEWTDGVQVGDRLQTALGAAAPKILTRQVLRRDAANLAPEVLDKLKTAPPYALWNLSPKCFALTLDREAPFQVGDSVFCPDRQGNGFTFVGNKIHSSGRLLIKAGSGIVADNQLITPHNITVCPEVPGAAAAGIQGLIIRNNLIREAGYFCPAPWSAAAGALSITASSDQRPQLRPAGVFANLLIEGNTFEKCNGPNLVISSARDVTVRANKFVQPHHTKPNDTGASYAIATSAVLWLSQSENVELRDNEVQDAGPFCGEKVLLTPSVKTK